MEEKTKKLESDLRDARDNAELLEFRLLELEQRESRERSPDITRKLEVTTATTSVWRCMSQLAYGHRRPHAPAPCWAFEHGSMIA